MAVVGKTTVATSLGAAAPRTLAFELANTGSRTVTPILLGRWGRGNDLSHVIAMPAQRPLAVGQRRAVRVPFELRALSFGDYTVRVEAQVVGYPQSPSASAPTSQWPITLVVILVVLLAVIASLIVAAIRRRRARAAAKTAEANEEPGTGSAPEPVPPATTSMAPSDEGTAAARAGTLLDDPG